jgi:hypothetical protein
MLTTEGNLILDRAADEYLPLEWYDDAGAEIDISQADLRFIVDKGFTLVPIMNPGNSKGRLLHFTEQHAASLKSNTRDYMLLLTQGTDNTVLMRGKISATGFAL